jgi:hypothetical protein
MPRGFLAAPSGTAATVVLRRWRLSRTSSCTHAVRSSERGLHLPLGPAVLLANAESD